MGKQGPDNLGTYCGSPSKSITWLGYRAWTSQALPAAPAARKPWAFRARPQVTEPPMGPDQGQRSPGWPGIYEAPRWPGGRAAQISSQTKQILPLSSTHRKERDSRCTDVERKTQGRRAREAVCSRGAGAGWKRAGRRQPLWGWAPGEWGRYDGEDAKGTQVLKKQELYSSRSDKEAKA